MRVVGLCFALVLAACSDAAAPEALPVGFEGCVLYACHGKVEKIHNGGAPLSCVDCHGGDPAGITKETGHPTVTVSFNPSSPGGQERDGQILRGAPLSTLDEVDPVILKFLNPSDYRVAPETCGSATRGGGNCHARITMASELSTHATLAGQLAGGLYFGGLTDKDAKFGVRSLTDPYPVPYAGMAETLALLPDDPSVMGDADLVAEGYFASYGQLCVECHLSRDGAHVPGKYTSSGCNACHMLTNGDGRPVTADPTQRLDEMGHVAKHRLTNLIPDSQCNRCHHAHLHRGLLTQGVREKSEPEGDTLMGGQNHGAEDPENAVYWDRENYTRYGGDYILYGKPYPFYVSDEDSTNDVDETPPDVHFEKGMGCIDCHTQIELHGAQHMPERREFEARVRCESCHGSPGERIDPDKAPFSIALSITGGNGDNRKVIAPGPEDELSQEGKLDQKPHPVTQIDRRLDPTEAKFNPRTQMGCGLHAGSAEFRAELLARYAATDPTLVDDVFPGMPEGATLPADLGTRAGNVECFTCHNAWTLNCYGCHVKRDDRETFINQATGSLQQGYVESFALSSVADALSMGLNSRGRVSPMVGTSIFFTWVGATGDVLVDAAPLMTVDGFSGDGNQHNPVHHHTIRRLPRDCQGCHPRADGLADDSEALARAVGFGTSRYVFVDGTGRRHLMDRTLAIDFDGDGEWDDPETALLGTLAAAVMPLAATTHKALDELTATFGPGPLDLGTVNRILGNPVVPQRPTE